MAICPLAWKYLNSITWHVETIASQGESTGVTADLQGCLWCVATCTGWQWGCCRGKHQNLWEGAWC